MEHEYDPTFITRVIIENYKSIEACDVHLGSLTLLVGPNGSGKSNFLDSLRFIADALHNSLDHALRERGGVKEVCRRTGSRRLYFKITIHFKIAPNDFRFLIAREISDNNRVRHIYADQLSGRFSFTVQTHLRSGYIVQNEECFVVAAATHENREKEYYYRINNGRMVSSMPLLAPTPKDRLFLINASSSTPFRYVYDYLSRMAFYSLNPDRIRSPQPPDAGDLLTRDGSNIASIIAQLNSRSKPTKQRIEEYLAKVAPTVSGVDARTIGPMETLEFRQQTGNAKSPWKFFAASMSDGTLRALGVLVALFQLDNKTRLRVPLVGIEEPEIALHPAATGVLFNALNESSQSKQVLITSHSPELLDSDDIKPESLLAVVVANGVTLIGPINSTGRFALREHLYTAGELLRLDQLFPDTTAHTQQQAPVASLGSEAA